MSSRLPTLTKHINSLGQSRYLELSPDGSQNAGVAVLYLASNYTVAAPLSPPTTTIKRLSCRLRLYLYSAPLAELLNRGLYLISTSHHYSRIVCRITLPLQGRLLLDNLRCLLSCLLHHLYSLSATIKIVLSRTAKYQISRRGDSKLGMVDSLLGSVERCVPSTIYLTKIF